MKTTLLFATISLISSFSFAGSKPYFVEPMKCTGRLVSHNPGMHPSYKDRVYNYEFTSFKSTRRDGSLANSLEIKTDMTSDYYDSPFYIDENGVIEKDMGGYSEVLTLKVVSAKLNSDGTYTDQLVGTITAQGTVVGNTVYNLNCTARVVKKVNRIDNYTSRR